MPSLSNVGIGQNPAMTTLLSYGAIIAFGNKVFIPERDSLSPYIIARDHMKSDFFSLSREGIIAAMLFLGVTDDDVDAPYIIEDNPSLHQILEYGGVVYNGRHKIWSDGEFVYVNQTRIGSFTLVSQGIALRVIGCASIWVRPSVIEDVTSNVRSRSITIQLSKRAGRQDVLGVISVLFSAMIKGEGTHGQGSSITKGG